MPDRPDKQTMGQWCSGSTRASKPLGVGSIPAWPASTNQTDARSYTYDYMRERAIVLLWT